jgi:hypothetical protein
MNDETLRRRIRQLVSDSSRMLPSPHAKKQMRKRRVSPKQVLQVLRSGYVVEHAHRNIKGNWQCTLEGLVAGDLIRVAAALMTDSDGDWVIVVTVMN